MGAFRIPDSSWEFLTKDHPQYSEVLETAPRTVFEVYKDASYKPRREMRKEANDAKRVIHLKTLYILRPNEVQCYWNDFLDRKPHAQLSAKKCQRLCQLVGAENERRKNCGQELVEVVEARSIDDVLRHDDLVVRNNLDPFQILGHVHNLGGIIDMVTSAPKKIDRNHRRVDLGACGARNSQLDDCSGLNKPATFKASNATWGKILMADMWRTFSIADPEVSAGVYTNPQRRAEFADKFTPEGIPGVLENAALTASKIHNAGLVPTEEEYFSLHVDTFNDHKDPSYSKVGSVSFFVTNKDGVVFRIAFICYGKQACYDFMQKTLKVTPVVNDVVDFFNGLPATERTVTMDLFPSPEEKDGKFLPRPHQMKTVLYSSARHVIREVVQGLPWLKSDPMYVIGLVFTSQVSNSPQHFYHETMNLLNKPTWMNGGNLEEMDPFEFTYHHYSHVFDVVRNPEMRCHEYRYRPRLPFTNTIRPTKLQVTNSMKVIARLIEETRRLGDKIEYDPTFFYHRAVEILKQTCWSQKEMDLKDPMPNCGCHGIGGLQAQHVVAILCLLGILPGILLSCAEVSKKSRPGEYLLTERGFSEDTFLRDTTYLLEAVSERIQQPQVVCEEAVCQTKIHLSGRRTGKGDWVPVNCPMVYLEEPTNFGRHKSRKRVALSIRVLNPDGTLTSNPDLGVSFEALSSLCPAWRYSTVSEYWKTGETEDKQPQRQRNRQIKAPQAQKLFPLKRKDAPLPTPDPYTVITFPRPSNAVVLQSAYNAVRSSNKTGKTTPSDKTLFQCLETTVKSQSPYENIKGTLSKKEKQRLRALQPRPGAAVRPGCSVSRKYFCYGVVLLQRGGTVVFPPADFPLRDDYNTGEHSVVVDGRRYFDTREAAREQSSMYNILTNPELYISSGSILAKELLSPPSDLNSVGRGDSSAIMAIKVFPQPIRRNPSRLPRMVGVSYGDGGYGIYYTDESGHPITPVYPVEPPSSGTRRKDGTRQVPYNGIVEHRNSGSRTEVYVSWCDGNSSWELLRTLVSSGSHWHLFRYAQSRGILDQPSWRRVKVWQAHQLGVAFFDTNKANETLEEVRKEEFRLKKGILRRDQRVGRKRQGPDVPSCRRSTRRKRVSTSVCQSK